MLAIEAPKGPKKDNCWTTGISMARRLRQDLFMRRPLDDTKFYGKMFSTKSFYEKTFGQHTSAMFPTRSFYEKTFGQHRFFMARCSQQDLFMRRPLDNTDFYGKMCSTKSFYEKTFGQHASLRQDGLTRSFYEKTFGQHNFDGKMFPTRRFYEKTFGQHRFLWQDVVNKIFL